MKGTKKRRKKKESLFIVLSVCLFFFQLFFFSIKYIRIFFQLISGPKYTVKNFFSNHGPPRGEPHD